MAQGNGEAVAWLDDLVQHIREMHDDILRASGGSPGEHSDRLIASCARPFQTAFGDLIYTDEVSRAAALFHGIITSHAFVDGNKRTASLVALLYLRASSVIQGASPLQVRLLGEVALETASTGLSVEDAAFWLHRIFDP
jgi:death-on-curing protein